MCLIYEDSAALGNRAAEHDDMLTLRNNSTLQDHSQSPQPLLDNISTWGLDVNASQGRFLCQRLEMLSQVDIAFLRLTMHLYNFPGKM